MLQFFARASARVRVCVWVCGVCVCVCVCVCISSIQINFLRNTAAVNWTLCCQMFGLLSYIKQELFRIQNVNLGVPPWKRNGCPTQVYPNRRFSTKVSPLYWKTAHDNQKLKETKAGNRRWQLTEQSLTIALTQNTVDAHRLIVQLVLRVLRTKGYVILQQVRRLYLWQCKTNLSFRFRFIAMDSTDSKNMLFAFTAIMWNCSQQSYETVHSNHVKLFTAIMWNCSCASTYITRLFLFFHDATAPSGAASYHPRFTTTPN